MVTGKKKASFVPVFFNVFSRKMKPGKRIWMLKIRNGVIFTHTLERNFQASDR